MRTKDQYTIAFKENDPQGHDIQFEQAYIEWWQNQRRDGGYRLTQQGCIHCIDKLELEYFEIKEELENTPGFLLDLDKYIKTPYYIKILRNKIVSIVLFDKKTYFTLTLYNNNFKKFINAHKVL